LQFSTFGRAQNPELSSFLLNSGTAARRRLTNYDSLAAIAKIALGHFLEQRGSELENPSFCCI